MGNSKKRPVTGGAIAKSSLKPKTAQPQNQGSMINRDMEVVGYNNKQQTPSQNCQVSVAAEQEAITFDYLLKKVVENTAGMTSTTQDGGTSLDHEEPMPTYEVRFDERENQSRVRV